MSGEVMLTTDTSLLIVVGALYAYITTYLQLWFKSCSRFVSESEPTFLHAPLLLTPSAGMYVGRIQMPDLFLALSCLPPSSPSRSSHE